MPFPALHGFLVTEQSDPWALGLGGAARGLADLPMTTRSHVAARTRRSGSGGSLAIGFSAAGVPAVDWQRNPRDHRGGVAEQNTIGPAISASVAHRPSGIASRNGPSTSSRPQYQADMGVITTVGLTEFTRMLYLPSSSAETRVMLSSAAFDEP